MGATTDDAKDLVDQIIDQQQVLAAAQAKHATLMLAFSDTRRILDHTRITNLRNDGTDPRYQPGEFAALEIGLAIKTNKHKIPHHRHRPPTARRNSRRLGRLASRAHR